VIFRIVLAWVILLRWNLVFVKPSWSPLHVFFYNCGYLGLFYYWWCAYVYMCVLLVVWGEVLFWDLCVSLFMFLSCFMFLCTLLCFVFLSCWSCGSLAPNEDIVTFRCGEREPCSCFFWKKFKKFKIFFAFSGFLGVLYYFWLALTRWTLTIGLYISKVYMIDICPKSAILDRNSNPNSTLYLCNLLLNHIPSLSWALSLPWLTLHLNLCISTFLFA